MKTENYRFDESVCLDSRAPFADWQPSPRQIREWTIQLRNERETRKPDSDRQMAFSSREATLLISNPDTAT